MRKLKLSLIILMLYLALFFNFERLEWKAGVDGVNIHSFVYVLVISSAVLCFLIPKIQRFSVFTFLFFWAVVYFALRLSLFNDTIFGGVETYRAITELTILMMATALAYKSAGDLGEFDKFVEEVYVPDLGKRILQFENAVEEVKTEFIRSRRHQLPLSLIVLRPSPEAKKTEIEVQKAVAEIQRHMTGRFIAASLAKIITAEARRNDMIISRGDEGPFIIVCPDTRGDQTINLVKRISDNVEEHLGLPISYGIASFPDQDLTFEGLINRAEFSLRQKEELGHIKSTEMVNEKSR